jgi:O-acetylserine/cysteine efflux transporter
VKTHLSRRDLALTLAIVALWGFSFVPIKVALVEVPPFTLAAVRFFVAAVPMVIFVRPPAMPWGNVVAYGMAIGVCQFGLLFLGIKLGMPAGLSSLVIQMQVFFTMGLAVLFAGTSCAATTSSAERLRQRESQCSRRTSSRAD